MELFVKMPVNDTYNKYKVAFKKKRLFSKLNKIIMNFIMKNEQEE